MGTIVEQAQELVRSLFGGSRDRWRHSRAAGLAAAGVAPTVAEHDRDLLIASAWLHDVGYAHPRPVTGFHPIDGALLLARAGWSPRLVSLVAHHSEARFAAVALGLDRELGVFEREEGPVADALIYADTTAGPDGRPMRLAERVADIHRRHGDDAPALHEARRRREPHIQLACARVDVRAKRQGLDHFESLPVSRRLADAEVVAGLVAEHPGRDLDVRAALHAVTSTATTRISPADLRRRARDLLLATAVDAVPMACCSREPGRDSRSTRTPLATRGS